MLPRPSPSVLWPPSMSSLRRPDRPLPPVQLPSQFHPHSSNVLTWKLNVHSPGPLTQAWTPENLTLLSFIPNVQTPTIIHAFLWNKSWKKKNENHFPLVLLHLTLRSWRYTHLSATAKFMFLTSHCLLWFAGLERTASTCLLHDIQTRSFHGPSQVHPALNCQYSVTQI